MSTQRVTILFRNRAGGAAILALALLATQAMAQQGSNSPPPQAAPVEPGVFESIGRWFEDGATGFRNHLRGAKERVDMLGDRATNASKNFGDTAVEVGKGAADATKSAVDAVVMLPKARVVQGRQICALAPNGAPDCQAAAEMLCRDKGFAAGKSIDFTSAEKCPARVWAAGQQANRAECTTETFISRAMCQ